MNLKDRIWGEFQSHGGRWAFVGVLTVAALLRLWVSWQPVEVLVQKNVPDDSFYYFMLARNTVQVGSVSVDGMNLTNGFHPLWLVVLMPIFGGASAGASLPIHLALTLASMMDLFTIWVIGQLAVSLTARESWGILAAWLYAANPFVILQITNGLETSLGLAMVALFVWLVKRWLTEAPNWRFAIAVGCSAGLAFLARSDSVFLIGLMLLAAIWYWREAQGFWRTVVAGCSALVVVSPWFIWSHLAVGSWMQDSAVAVPFAIRQRLAMQQGAGLYATLRESLSQLANPAPWLRGDYLGLPLFFGMGIWLLVLVGLLKRWQRPAARLEKAILLPLLLGGVALYLVHTGVRWYPRPWYFISASMAFALASALVGASYLRKTRNLFLVALILTVYFAFSGDIFWRIGYSPWQIEMLEATDWLGENVPAGNKAGALNSGIYTYHSEFPVINLDGVVNYHAFQAIQDQRLLEYLQASGVDYLIDYDVAIWEQYAPFMGEGFADSLQEVAVLGGGADQPFGLLRVFQVGRASGP